MNTNRRIQLSAAAVILNGILALSASTPRTAIASSCSDNNYWVGCLCRPAYPCLPVSGCSGGAICVAGFCGGIGATFCVYN